MESKSREAYTWPPKLGDFHLEFRSRGSEKGESKSRKTGGVSENKSANFCTCSHKSKSDEAKTMESISPKSHSVSTARVSKHQRMSLGKSKNGSLKI